MLEELQRRNFAATTITTYLKAVEQFARYFKCRPDRLNHTHLRTYQVYLLRERKLMPHTVRLHVAALRFFFVKTLKRRYLLDDTPYPKAPRRLPSILSVDEVTQVIDAAASLSHRTMLMVLYSTGMRNAELRHLQVADIDSRRMLIHIRQGKGGRDRFVPLSATLLVTLRASWPPAAPDSANAASHTSCDIPTPRTCLKAARTSGPSSCCWAMRTCDTPCCTCIYRSGTSKRSPIRWMPCPCLRRTPRVARV